MRIDLNCPAEILNVDLPKKEEPWVTLVLMDGTDRGINSCEATIRILDSAGEELSRTVHRARALGGRPHSTFTMTVPMERPEGAALAEARLDKVWFEDNDVWRRNAAAEVEYESNVLPAGNDLNALKYVAGPAAVGFPSQQAALWVCVCGRANGNRDFVCRRCGRRKETIFQQYNRNAVLQKVNQRERQLDLRTRGVREEAAAMQRIREAAYNERQNRKGYRRRLAALAAAALLLTAGCGMFGVQGLRLWSANRAAEDGRLEQAEEILTDLGTFPGAEARLAKTRLTMARRDGTAAADGAGEFEEERLKEISALLRSAGTEETDAPLADRVDLKRAESLLAAGNTAEAEALTLSLPEKTAGRADLLDACAYARGRAAMAGRDYAAARAVFLSLGNYREAETLAKDCLYEPALAMIEDGDYEGAIANLEQIAGYQDSGELILKSLYLKGMTLEGTGNTEEARQAYLAAGDYEDAADRAKRLRRAQADAEMAVQNYAAAMAIFQELDGQGDARDQWIYCATELARAAYKLKDYDRAAELLTGLPEDTKETENIRTRALFLGAKAAAEQGDLEKAVNMMERVAGYGDSRKQIRTWRLALAEEAMGREAWEDARGWLEPLSDTYTAQRMLKQIDSRQTEQAAAAAEEEKAEAADETSADGAAGEKSDGTDEDAQAEGAESGDAAEARGQAAEPAAETEESGAE